MKQLWKQFETRMNNLTIKKKLLSLYLICVLLPLILTDSIIFHIVLHSEQKSREHDMENIASAVKYSFVNRIDNAARAAKGIYTNHYIDSFLEKEYDSPLDYVTSYQSFFKDTLFENGFGIDHTLATMYVDNDTIVNGGVFKRLELIKDIEWYQKLRESGRGEVFYFYYDNSNTPVIDAKRRILFIRKLNFYRNNREKVLVLEMNYKKMVEDLVKMNYDAPVYICSENKILLSNNGHTSIGREFEMFRIGDKAAYTKEMDLYGTKFTIYVLRAQIKFLPEMMKNFPLLLLLICINVILPLLLMYEINHSFTSRLRKLSEVFEGVEDEKLVEIRQVQGTDEIGSLMRNYNKMAERTNELIQTVFKDKLKEQEINITRQKAELLALHSQVNPHFIFNALESIRMHSILKKEYETADMVEKLATMERQYVEWGDDLIDIGREISFVNAYLGLQKYRFGDRMSYNLEIEQGCNSYKIPKLTVVTFVENACVHGIESKTAPGWIFVRVYRQKDVLCLEIEDTGIGMEETEQQELYEKMLHASMERLKDGGRVGIINACLRLKMLTKEEVQFKLEGEKGVGTLVQIFIPFAYIE